MRQSALPSHNSIIVVFKAFRDKVLVFTLLTLKAAAGWNPFIGTYGTK